MARTVNAIVPYYGAKRQIAKVIVEALGKHHSYLSPFCGSLAVELVKPPCRMEVVNDLNGALVNLLRVVRDDNDSVELFEKLNRTSFCEELYRDSVDECSAFFMEEDRPTQSVAWAYHYFVMSWMGRNGFVGSELESTSGFCKRFTSGGGDPATRFRNAVEGIPAWWDRVRNMTVLSEDGIAIFSRFEDAEGAVAFVDPPYITKQAKYIHDFAIEQHHQLAEALKRFKKTRVVLSYYDDPLVDELYVAAGWKKTLVDVNKNLSVGAETKKAPEVLLTNR